MNPPSNHPVIITRRIQILLQSENKERWKEGHEKLQNWQKIVARAANWIATHHYVQENLKDLFYLAEGIRSKLTDVHKDEAGLLNTTRMSSTYRLLSRKFKGQIPMAILSSLNNRILTIFDKEKLEYREGKRSLRTYKQDLPIPIVHSDILHIRPAGKGNYSFNLYGLSFRTHFGRDASGNRQIFENALHGEYKLCNSSIEIRKDKLFLLAVFRFDKIPVKFSEEIRVEASLSVTVPIEAVAGENRIQIGSQEEYLHRRLAIQEGMHRAQLTIRFNKGGKGRKKKMMVLERFHKLEKNYVDTRLHQYSARLIAFCLQQKAGVLLLRDQSKKEAEARNDEFLLRNWSYHGLKEKIKYKAAKYGIVVISE